MTVMVCGIGGGSGAGKTTLTRRVVDRLGPDRVAVLTFDSYYRDHAHLSPEERRFVNYDHPDSLDHELFVADLARLRDGLDVEVPVYDFATHTRTGEHRPVLARTVVIVEGILLFSFPEVVALLDMRLYLDVPESVRLERRIRRDVAERGRDADDVRRQFAATVGPMHDEFVEPFRGAATRVVRIGEPFEVVADEAVAELATGATVSASL